MTDDRPHEPSTTDLPPVDRATTCPLCHHNQPLPQPAMDAFAMLACPRCLGRWAVCTADDLPDYDADYDTTERDLYRRYDEERRQIQAGREPPIYWFQRRQLERIGPFGQRRLLEIGCGNGMFLLAARRAGWHAEGLEVSERATVSARRISGCPVHVGRLADLAADRPGFEVISAFEILEHVLDPAADLRTMADALVPGGLVTLSVPNDRSPHTRNPPDPEGRPPYHVNFFQPQTLVTVLRDVGLDPAWLYEKPFAWSETNRRPGVRLLMLPWLAFAGYVLGHKGSRLVAWARKTAGWDAGVARSSTAEGRGGAWP